MVSQWRDAENTSNDIPFDPWGNSDDLFADRVGIYVEFADGTKGTTALTQEACDFVTKNIRIPVMRGEWDGVTSVMGKATVDGKL